MLSTTPEVGRIVRTLVAIPCFNEELAIGSMVLQAKPYATDVLVVDDGSADRTAEVAKLAGAQVIVHPKNAGKGKAVQNAFKYAHDKGYDALVLMDGDGQHDPREIPLMLKALADPEVDLALGFRFGDKTEMPGWRRAGKRVLDYATAVGGGGAVTDSQCGFRGFNKKAIQVMAERLGATGFGVESEQLVVAKENGLKFQNVTIHCRYEGIDGSTKGPVAHATGVLANLVAMVTMRRPLLFVGVPSLILILLAVGLTIFTLQAYNASRVFSVPYALLTATVGLIGVFGLFTALLLNLVAMVEKRLAGRE
jgi:glycosyltransferase involved in cell wall biosynthesis